MCSVFFASADKTAPRASRERFTCVASRKARPWTSDFVTRSLPARSTKDRREVLHISFPFAPPTPSASALVCDAATERKTDKMRCERELRAFREVAAKWSRRLAAFKSCVSQEQQRPGAEGRVGRRGRHKEDKRFIRLFVSCCGAI